VRNTVRAKAAESSKKNQNKQAAESLEVAAPRGILQTFLQHQDSLRNYISRFMVSAHEIDDVSQETFLRAYKAEQKTIIKQPKAFLFRIAKNMMLSEFSSKSRKMIDYVEDFEQVQLQGSTPSLEDHVIAGQKIGVYCEAIASLPPRCRQVILMKKVYGMSHKEIARRMEVSVSAVEKHLIKGGKKCTEHMAVRYPQEHLAAHTGEVSPGEPEPPVLSLVNTKRKG
jgi:RNA polymerase sigma factor (sigma-70 family)